MRLCPLVSTASLLLAFVATEAHAGSYTYLECRPGIPPSNGLFAAINGTALRPVHASLKILVHRAENFLIACGARTDGTPYSQWYGSLLEREAPDHPEPLTGLGSMHVIGSGFGWDALANADLPAATFRIKSWAEPENPETPRSAFVMWHPEARDPYYVFTCEFRPTPTTTDFCGS